MRWILASIALLLASAGELAAQGKGIRFWNLTVCSVGNFHLERAGAIDHAVESLQRWRVRVRAAALSRDRSMRRRAMPPSLELTFVTALA